MILPICLIITSLLLLTFDIRCGKGERFQGIVLSLFSPLERSFSFFPRKLESFKGRWATVRGLKEENLSLRRKKEELERELSRLRSILGDDSLRELLAYRESISSPLVIAEVIGRDATDWFNTVLLDKGSKDGVRKDMVVITHRGLVGRVMDVGPISCRVMLILDEASRVSALLERSRDQGIVRGSGGGTCVMTYLSSDADVRKGDMVRSSGWGGIYPAEIPVGTVEEVRLDRSGLFRIAEVKTAVDFSKLERVMVILKEQPG